MKKTFLILIVALAYSSFVHAADHLKAQIQSLLKPYGDKVAFSVRDLQGNELFQSNGKELFSPASVAKSVSTACSLWKLGPQYQFETKWGYRGKIENSTLIGDLVVRGSGDPSMVSEQIQDTLARIRTLYGIKVIRGSLIFDVSEMGGQGLTMAEGFEGDQGRSFATLLTPLPLNQNSFSFWAAPDLNHSQKTRITLWPTDVLSIKITNQVRIGAKNTLSVSYSPDTMTATVSGTTSHDGDLRGSYRAAPNAYDYYFKLIERYWINAGGEWKQAKYEIQNSLVTMKPLYIQRSKPLSQIMMDVNKFSLNLAAELIFLRAGASEENPPVTYDKSRKMLKSCLETFKISEGILLQNASGLSRESKLQASTLTQFLINFYQHPYSPEYLSSLSLMGSDGTTKNRLKKFQGRGRLKTGTLRDVHSLAGYLFDEEHKPYAFAVLFNRVSMGDQKLQKTEDQIVEALLESDFKF